MIRKILQIFFWLGVAAIFIVVSTSAVEKQSSRKCMATKIDIDFDTGLLFVSGEDVRNIVNETEKSVTGKCLEKIHFSRMERKLENHPHIQNAEVFADMNGTVVFKIIQRRPVARVIHSNDVSYYIDENGKKMPLSSNFTARVPVITGYLHFEHENTGELKSTSVKNAFEVVDYLSRNEFWKAQLEQIYLNEQGEMELVTRLGDHTVLIGNNENLEDKMNRLMIFYREGLKSIDAGNYKLINVKFKDQIIGVKN